MLQVTLTAYSNNPSLQNVYEQYRYFVDQGGQIEPPATWSANDSQIQAFIAEGDVILAQVGAGTQQVVIGKNININPGQLLRTPLQRPPRTAHFQDRKNDLVQLIADLQPGSVVTLCGPGGIGKSALAAEAVWQLAPGAEPPALFPNGILFYSFYNQPQAVLALEHIARSFSEEIKPNPKQAAQRALAGRCALLILDGTEQADDLHMLLDIRDQCGVLVTSRTRSDAVDKRQDVTPLPLDDAVVLLQAWGGSRATDVAIAYQIAELVGRLPLALRLVGRYLAQNEENAGNYLAWLAATPLTALNQGQRSEQSVSLLLARSLEQVSEQAHQVLGMIGVLAFTSFPWEMIASALELSGADVRRSLGELVNYGLLLRPKETYEVTHVLIHTYARLQLAPPIEAINRLAIYYTMFVERHQGDFEQLNYARLQIMSLLPICNERQAWQALRNLAWVIDDYLDVQGYWTERMTSLKIGLGAVRALSDRVGEGVCLGKLGTTYAVLGYVQQAIEYFQQALIISQEIGDRRGEGAHLGNMGLAYANLGQVEQTIKYLQQALVIAQEVGDRWGAEAHLSNLGNVFRDLGQVEQAIGYHQQALIIAQEIGDRRSEGIHLGNLGLAHAALAQVERAIGYHQQALIIAQDIGDRRSESNQLGNLGIVYADLGRMGQAIEYYQQAITIAQEIGDRRGEGTNLGNMGLAYAALGQIEEAIGYHQQALTIAQDIGHRRNESNHLGSLGLAYAALGQVEQAIGYHQQALTIAKESSYRRSEGIHLGNLGIVYGDLGQVEQAIEYYQQALTIAQEIGDRRSEGVHLGSLGLAYADIGQVERAIEYYKQALIIAQDIGDRGSEGIQLGNLSNVYSNLGQLEQARQVGKQALRLFEEIKSPHAGIVRQWLSSLQSKRTSSVSE